MPDDMKITKPKYRIVPYLPGSRHIRVERKVLFWWVNAQFGTPWPMGLDEARDVMNRLANPIVEYAKGEHS